jgi:hypothetical protein
MSKLATILGLGVLMLAGLGGAAPGHAQGLPQGSYLGTCSGARVDGASLIARCRDAAGVEQHSALVNFDRCVGDIANNGGALSCNMGAADAAPAPAADAPVTRVAIDCSELHRRDADLKARLNIPANPVDRGRLEGELHQVQTEEDHCTQ